MRGSRWSFLFLFVSVAVVFAGVARGQCAHGDPDGSGTLDLSDYSAFVDCASTPPGTPLDAECGPVDFDGDMDVDKADFGTFQRLFGVTHGVFLDNPEFGVGDGPRDVAIGDLDGDGDLDLAVANGDGDSVSVVLNHGSGTFAHDVLYGGIFPRSVSMGDLDGDGDLDLAVANASVIPGTVSVLLNEGNGTFADHCGLRCGDRACVGGSRGP